MACGDEEETTRELVVWRCASLVYVCMCRGRKRRRRRRRRRVYCTLLILKKSNNG